MKFVGTVHPPPRESRQHPADFDAAEIASTNLGNQGLKGKTTPILVEHDGPPVGEVLASYRGTTGSLRVMGNIYDKAAQELVKSGQMLGLSLGTETIHHDTPASQPVMRKVTELSIVERPLRPGCHIIEADGHRVHTSLLAASASASALDKDHNDAGNQVADMDTHTSDTIAKLNEQLLEKTKRLAAFEAEEKKNDERQREELGRYSGKVQAFMTGVEDMVDNSTELEHVKDDLLKARVFYESIPSMPMEKIHEFRPLMTVACKASAAYEKIEEMKTTTAEKDKALKRSLEDGEAKDIEIQRLRRDNSEITQLAEERQRQCEDVVRQLHDVSQRAAKHDFSAPVQKQYQQSMQNMHNHLSKNKQTEPGNVIAPEKSGANANNTQESENPAMPGTNGLKLTRTILNASAGSDTATAPARNIHNVNYMDHVNHLSNMIRSNAVASTNIHFSKVSQMAGSSSSAHHSDVEIVMASAR